MSSQGVQFNEKKAQDFDTEMQEEASIDSDTSILILPRLKRRGLLSQLCLIPEYKDAKSMPKYVKSYVVFLIALASATSPACTSMTYPAIDQMTQSFNTTRSTMNITVGLFILALGVFPIWWSQFSERFGRRSIYVVSFTLFVAFQLGCALVKNIAGFGVLRTLVGASSGAVYAVGAGTIADIYEPQHRGRAMGYYYLGPLIAPLIFPIVGSLLLLK